MVSNIQSSEHDLKSFKTSSIWKDVETELLSWLEDIHFKLEDPLVVNPNGTYGFTDKELHRFAGNAETIRKVLTVVDMLLYNINLTKEEKKNVD